MNRCILALLLLTSFVDASPADAERIQKAHQLAMDTWALEMRVASTPEARAKAASTRPDLTPYVKKMWAAIGQSLDKESTIEPAAWFLRTAPELLATTDGGVPTPIFTKELEAIRKAVETHHLASTKLMPICAALASSPDSRSLALLEKIQETNPDPKIQGVAALGAAIQLKAISDDGEMMRRRLTYLRKAIIQSSDVDLGGITVAKIAEDELYIIQFLTKGRVAPDLVGVDSANRPLSLSAHKGKVIVLLFWNNDENSTDRVLDMTTTLAAKFRDRPVVVLGVNSDPVEKLRAMQADGSVTWPNFSDPENKLAREYRVGTKPLVYVLDGDRKIHYTGGPGSFAELTAEALIAEIKP